MEFWKKYVVNTLCLCFTFFLLTPSIIQGESDSKNVIKDTTVPESIIAYNGSFSKEEIANDPVTARYRLWVSENPWITPFAIGAGGALCYFGSIGVVSNLGQGWERFRSPIITSVVESGKDWDVLQNLGLAAPVVGPLLLPLLLTDSSLSIVGGVVSGIVAAVPNVLLATVSLYGVSFGLNIINFTLSTWSMSSEDQAFFRNEIGRIERETRRRNSRNENGLSLDVSTENNQIVPFFLDKVGWQPLSAINFGLPPFEKIPL
ncbi:hypothetical protein EB093_04960 [bacterium]|nr:hypothetical protein [bacterium]